MKFSQNIYKIMVSIIFIFTITMTGLFS